jgi:mono/diheme cytochrome c family protein
MRPELPRAAFALSLMAALPAFTAEPTAEQLEFFENKIRPVLAEHCYSCHSAQAEKLKGGLLLDTRAGLLKGGDTGPAIVPGEPDKSLLIKAVRYTDPDLKMPPTKDGNKRLAPEKIADLEAWVRMGAPDPRTNNTPPSAFDLVLAKGKSHWAFQPVAKPPIPAVKNQRWVQTPIDAFVLAKLEPAGMHPSPQADKRTLLRRATYDLTGLPPAPEEVAAFVADRSPEAFARAVDRLLASPRYGERWGRHWLDVARYADTKGYVGGEEVRYPYAYTYRDYVVRAFNEDLPYDRFIVEQIAADRLALGDDNRPLAALGFLTLGRRFINNEQDIIDDRLDVICRGLMGVTIQCARCHDHKYDPVPTRDYYSLYGVMKSSTEPGEKPLLARQPKHPQFEEFVAARAKKQAEMDDYVRTNTLAVQAKLREQINDYLLLVYEHSRLTNETDREKLVRDRKLNKFVRDRWVKFFAEAIKTNHPIFTPWFAFHALTNEAQFATQARQLAAKFAANSDPTNRLNPLVARMFAGDPPAAMTNVIQRYGNLLSAAHQHWQDALKLSDPVTVRRPGETNPPPPLALADPDEEAIRLVIYAPDAPHNPPPDQFGNLFLFDDGIKGKIEEFKRALANLDATHPGAPPRAMAMEDKPKPEEVRVFIRGNAGSPGTNAPRRFLALATPGERPLFPTNSSGRLELARAIASRDNPLTARVFVNRVWLHHFGAGLVRTPGDFGLRAEPPSHPELLDWLAAWFMDQGWSVKKLHRLILLSSTYQQASQDHPQFAARDPDNRLLWRQQRRRLDFEAMRDSLLAVAGQLDTAQGGQPVDIAGNALNRRRTLYGYVDRQDLPNLFRIFDFANPDTSSPQRFQTTVAAQALFLMNSPLVIERAKNLVAQPAFARLHSDEDRTRFLFGQLLQREPARSELALAGQFVAASPTNEIINVEMGAWRYGYGRYDENTRQVAGFKPFAHFSGQNWQVAGAFPDPKLGYLFLNAEGGHPTDGGLERAVIRRWIAPRDGTVSVQGELGHANKEGDGVRGRIVHSRTGELGVWTALNTAVPTAVTKLAVQAGDTLDFVVDCLANTAHDTFKWAPVISWMDPAPMGEPLVWDAAKNFGDVRQLPKPLAPWEKFAQALLLSNEFMFVD